jgi:hypothetical protein
MHANVETARQILVETLRKISPDFPNSQADALKFSIITDKSKISKTTCRDLDLILGRYLD